MQSKMLGRKQKITSIIIIIMIIGVTYSSIHPPAGEYGNTGDDSLKINDEVLVPGTQNLPIGDASAADQEVEKSSAVVSDQSWQIGESMLVTLDHTTSFLDMEHIQLQYDVMSSDTYNDYYQYDFLSYSLENDTDYARFVIRDNTGYYVYGSWLFRFYAPVEGTFYFGFYFTNSGGDTGDWVYGTHSITDSHIDAEGYFYIKLSVYDDGEIGTANMYAINQKEVLGTEVLGSSTSTVGSAFTWATAWVDYLYFIPDSKSYHLRSEFMQLDPVSYSHRLVIDNPVYDSNITITVPNYMEFTYAEPYCNYLDSGITVTLYNTIPAEYSVYFVSGDGKGRDYDRKAQYLAIEPSDDYFIDGDFEAGISPLLDRYNTDPSNIDSITFNSTIVSSGSLSCRLYDDDSSAEYYYYSSSVFGGFYLSYDYFFVDGPSTMYIEFVGSGGTETRAVSNYTDNIWHKEFLYIHPTALISSSPVQLFRFVLTGGNYELFLDNLKIWQVSLEVESAGYSAINSTADFISWDGRNNPVASLLDVEYALYDRSAGTLVDSYSTLTDAFGGSSWLWQGYLEAKEYEWRVWSYDSYFSGASSILNGECLGTESVTSWSVLSATGSTITLSSDRRVGSYSIVFTVSDSSGSSYLQYNPAGTWDVSYCDYAVFYASRSTSGNLRFTIDSLANGDIDPDTSLTKYEITLSEAMKLTAANTIQFEVLNSVVNYVIKLDGIHLIQSQKVYFTPKVTGFKDYFAESGDAKDFSEGDTDGAGVYYSGKSENSVSNGCLNNTCIISGNWYGGFTFYSGISYRPSFYDTVIIRAKALGDTIDFFLQANGAYIYAQTNDLTTAFKIFEVDISSWGSATRSQLIVHYNNGTPQMSSVGDGMIVDYVYLVHRDSSFQSGYSWEFEETGYLDGATTSTGAGLTTENGYLSITPDVGGYSTCTAFIGGQNALNVKAANYDRAYFKIKANVDDSKCALYDGVGLIVDSWIDPIPTVWTVYVLDLVAAWSGVENSIEFYFKDSDNSADEGDEIFDISFFRLISADSPVNLNELTGSFFTESETNELHYAFYSDYSYMGEFADNSLVSKNNTAGDHNMIYAAISESGNNIYLPAVFYYQEYTVNADGLMKINVYDNAGEIIPVDQLKTYLDGSRLYDNYYFATDITASFTLEIKDLLDNQLYYNASESFEYFKDIQVSDFYTMKIMNWQPNPVHINVTKGALQIHEWVFPFEVVKYRLYSTSYTVYFYYSEGLADWSAVFNGTSTSYEYTLDKDTAITVTGNTITDVFGSVSQLAADLTEINATLYNQIITVDLNVANVNTSLYNQILNVNITLANTNTTIFSELTSISTDISSVNATLYQQAVDILTNLALSNQTIFNQTVDVLAYIVSSNNSIYSGLQTINTTILNVEYILDNFNASVIDILTSTPQFTVIPSNQTLEYLNTSEYEWQVNQIVAWQIYRNGTVIESGETSVPDFTVTGTTEAVYNYTVFITNQFQKTNSSTFWLTVDDTTAPVISSLTLDNNTVIEYTAAFRSITVYHSESCNYSSYVNGSVTTGSGATSTFRIIALGVANCTLVLTDNNSNAATYSYYFTVSDTTAPQFASYDVDKAGIVGDVIRLSIPVIEVNNFSYTIIHAGSTVKSGTESGSAEIFITASFSAVGLFTYQFNVIDDSGNSKSGTVTVTITESKEGADAYIQPTSSAASYFKPRTRMSAGFEWMLLLASLPVALLLRRKYK